MNRRFFIKSSAILAGLMGFPFVNLKAEPDMKKINFRHVVYFWLNEPENQSQNKLFLKNLKEFIDGMDNILDIYIGVPANTYREVVENSYQYSLNLGFENKTQHDIYQDHPLHKKFVSDTAHLWKKVVVYDSVPVR